jgi:ketosteroid isomerase-like protein
MQKQQLPHVLPPVVTAHIDAVNAFDSEGVLATFTDDALVNDNHREFWGAKAIRDFIAKEIVGDHVTMAVTEVVEHGGLIVVRARYDGDYDKTGLPDELILTNYFTVTDGRISTLFIIHNQG